ncbi:adenylylsulfate reductase subunit beta [Desulfospira joergensenii]|uniref:adenylylsulfate reductase subunit beta n=1 Tax=Desulfospira joergensenii TaxID=53329 RepID=UPI0003B4A8BC
MARTVISKKDVKASIEKISHDYNTSVSIENRFIPMMNTEDIMWTCKFRNGVIKRFKFPIRTSPEGESVSYEDSEEGSQKLASEDLGLNSSPEIISELPLEPDKYKSRLLKYIPAEIIALYMTLDSLIRSLEKTPIGIYWVIVIFCLVSTYLYLWRVQKVKKQAQLFISVMACLVWIFAIGGPFAYLNWYNPVYGGLLLPAYTFSIAIFEA